MCQVYLWCVAYVIKSSHNRVGALCSVVTQQVYTGLVDPVVKNLVNHRISYKIF